MEKKQQAGKGQPSPPVKRTRRSREDILARIFDAAKDEFKRRGYLGATTAEIARQADVTEAQLFRYFESKEALFHETIFKPIDQHFSAFLQEHKSKDLKTLNSPEMYQLYTSELHRFVSDNSEMLTSLLVAQAYERGTSKGAGPIKNLKIYFDHGAAMLRQTREGEPLFNPQIMVRIAFATVLACVIFKRWIFPKEFREKDITAGLDHFIRSAMTANFKK